MAYGDSIWNGDGWIGRVCTDPACTVILHETTESYPTEHEAGYAAFAQWGGDQTTQERKSAPPIEDAA